jgi:hypothetical protein
MPGLPIAMPLIVTALLAAAPALADPAPPPPDPVPAPAPPGAAEFVPQQTGIGNPLAQSGSQPAGLFGMPDLSGLGANLLLGQNAAPAAPGDPAAAPVVPTLNTLNPEYLLAQNMDPAVPGGGTPAPGLAPNEDIPGTGRISFLHRIYEMYQGGGLKGSLLGQQSPEEFDQSAAEQAAEKAPAQPPAPATTTALPPPPG